MPVIALAGKGGAGKTTVAALLVRHVVRKRPGTVLAIDADPSSNLHFVLRQVILRQISTVASGQGGVGKSTVAALRAWHWRWSKRARVVLLDADFHGPTCRRFLTRFHLTRRSVSGATSAGRRAGQTRLLRTSSVNSPERSRHR